MTVRIRTDLKIIPYSKIYEDIAGAPNGSYVKVRVVGGKTHYVMVEELAELKMHPDRDFETGEPQITSLYLGIQERKEGIKVRRRDLGIAELIDICDEILHAERFGKK